MTTRIQELLLRFNISDSNEAAVSYLTKYVNKGELSEQNSCSLLALSLDSLKSNEWYTQNTDLTDFIDKGFLLKNSIPDELKSSSPSSARKEETVEPCCSTSFVPVNGPVGCSFDIQRQAFVAKVKDEIMGGIRSFNEKFKDVPDRNKITFIVKQLEFLVEREGSLRPPLPTDRVYNDTDIVYLKSSELRNLSKMYIKLADVGYDATFIKMVNNSRLYILGRYMSASMAMSNIVHYVTEGMKLNEPKLIVEGFRSLMKVVRAHDNDIDKVVNYGCPIRSVRPLGIIFDCDKSVLVMMIQSIVEYSDLLEDRNRTQQLVLFFKFHPFYKPLCEYFFYFDIHQFLLYNPVIAP